MGSSASLVYMVMWFVTIIQGENAVITAVGTVPILIADVLTALWLLIAGIKTSVVNLRNELVIGPAHCYAAQVRSHSSTGLTGGGNIEAEDTS